VQTPPVISTQRDLEELEATMKELESKHKQTMSAMVAARTAYVDGPGSCLPDASMSSTIPQCPKANSYSEFVRLLPEFREHFLGLNNHTRYKKCDYYHMMNFYERVSEVEGIKMYTMGRFLRHMIQANIIPLQLKEESYRFQLHWEDYNREETHWRKLKPNDQRAVFCRPSSKDLKRGLDTAPNEQLRKQYKRMKPTFFSLTEDALVALNIEANKDGVEIYGTKANRPCRLRGIRTTGSFPKGHKIRLGGELILESLPHDHETDDAIESLQDGNDGYIKFTPTNPKKHGGYRRHFTNEEANCNAGKVNAIVGWCMEDNTGVLKLSKHVRVRHPVTTGPK
jgi:hypothetical protein